jgi:predicted nucleotidyltransferase
MPRTALDLTTEELILYRPGRVSDTLQTSEKWEQAWEVARAVAHLLRERFGARQVIAFGSIVHRAWFTPWSDIDIAVWGIPAHQFYQAVAVVTGISPDFKVDVVDVEDCSISLRRIIESEGIEL